MVTGLSKIELIGIMEAIDKALRVNDEEDFKALLRKAAELTGNEFSICGFGRPDLSEVNIINCNYPDEWVQAYSSERMYFNDPVVQYQLQFTSTVDWEFVNRNITDKRALNVIQNAKDFSLNSGISSGIYDPDTDTMGVFSFANEKKVLLPNQKAILNILAPHLYAALKRIERRR